MKIIISFLLLISIFHANEIQRIESIVDDISKLRVDYEKCQERLNNYKSTKPDVLKKKKSLKASKQKNIILKAELDYIRGASSTNIQTIKKYKKLLKLKNKEIKDLKKKLARSKKSSKTTKTTLEICKVKKDDNPFPKLMKKANTKKKQTRKKVIKQEKITSSKPASFRLKNNSIIYNSPNGIKIKQWEKQRTFTSNIKTQNWIKITGYFVDKQWVPAKITMWIKTNNVVKK